MLGSKTISFNQRESKNQQENKSWSPNQKWRKEIKKQVFFMRESINRQIQMTTTAIEQNSNCIVGLFQEAEMPLHQQR